MSGRFWIQNADLTSTPDHPLTNGLDVLKWFDQYDWSEQWALQSDLEARGEVFGAPGFGVVRKTGVILHICPYSDGTVFGFWHTRLPKKKWFIIPSYDKYIQRVNDLRFSVARMAILKFVEGDDQWLYDNFRDS